MFFFRNITQEVWLLKDKHGTTVFFCSVVQHMVASLQNNMEFAAS